MELGGYFEGYMVVSISRLSSNVSADPAQWGIRNNSTSSVSLWRSNIRRFSLFKPIRRVVSGYLVYPGSLTPFPVYLNEYLVGRRNILQKVVAYDIPSLGIWNSPSPDPQSDDVQIPTGANPSGAPTYVPKGSVSDALSLPVSGNDESGDSSFDSQSLQSQRELPANAPLDDEPNVSTGEMLNGGTSNSDYYAAMVISTHGTTFELPQTYTFTQEQVNSGEVQTFADALRDKGVGFDAVPVSDQWISDSDSDYATHESEWQEVDGPVHSGYTDADYAADHNADHDNPPSSITDDAYGFGTDTASSKGGFY